MSIEYPLPSTVIIVQRMKIYSVQSSLHQGRQYGWWHGEGDTRWLKEDMASISGCTLLYYSMCLQAVIYYTTACVFSPVKSNLIQEEALMTLSNKRSITFSIKARPLHFEQQIKSILMEFNLVWECLVFLCSFFLDKIFNTFQILKTKYF